MTSISQQQSQNYLFYPQLYQWRSPSPSAVRGCPPPATHLKEWPPAFTPVHVGFKTSPQHMTTRDGKNRAPPNGLLCNPPALSRHWGLFSVYFWPQQHRGIIILKWPDKSQWWLEATANFQPLSTFPFIFLTRAAAELLKGAQRACQFAPCRATAVH